jgi:hypothetical protein
MKVKDKKQLVGYRNTKGKHSWIIYSCFACKHSNLRNCRKHDIKIAFSGTCNNQEPRQGWCKTCKRNPCCCAFRIPPDGIDEIFSALSVRSANVVFKQSEGCRTLQELKDWLADLIKKGRINCLRGCGIKTQNEIRAWLGFPSRPKYDKMLPTQKWKYNPITGEPLFPPNRVDTQHAAEAK